MRRRRRRRRRRRKRKRIPEGPEYKSLFKDTLDMILGKRRRARRKSGRGGGSGGGKWEKNVFLSLFEGRSAVELRF